jgi:hypothetical protein
VPFRQSLYRHSRNGTAHLEGICKDSGISERVLANGLKRMKEQGLMDETLAEWADGLRLLGNQGAPSRAGKSDVRTRTTHLHLQKHC